MNYIEREMYDYEYNEMYESVFGNPIKKFKDSIEKIRKSKPTEFDKKDKIKDFVDENYGKIMDAAAILEKEPESLRKNDIATLTTIGVLFAANMGLIIAASSVATITISIVLTSIMFLYSIVISIINYIRMSDDTKVSNDLAKIRSSLKKIDTKKLPEKYRIKINKMITAIDDAETEISSRIQVSKESVDELKLSIFESFENGEIDEIEKDILLEKLEDSYYTEGANLESRRYFKEAKKEFKNAMKMSKESIKNERYSEAKKYIDDAISVLKVSSKKIKSTDTTTGSFIFGILTMHLPHIGRDILAHIVPGVVVTAMGVGTAVAAGKSMNSSFSSFDAPDFVPSAKHVASMTGVGIAAHAARGISFFTTLYSIIEAVAQIADNVKGKKFSEWTLDDFNFYKNNCLSMLDKYIKKLEKYKKHIDVYKKNQKSVKESVDELKLSIYESFENGEIDEIEKDILLEKLEDSYYESTAQARNSIKLKKEIDNICDNIDKLEKDKEKYQNEKNLKMVKDINVKIVKLKKEKDTIINKLHRVDPDFKASDAFSSGKKAAFNKSKHGDSKSYSAMRDVDEHIDAGRQAAYNNRWRGNSDDLKESVDELKLSIYESFENGEIDEIEKDILLEKLEDSYY